MVSPLQQVCYVDHVVGSLVQCQSSSVLVDFFSLCTKIVGGYCQHLDWCGEVSGTLCLDFAEVCTSFPTWWRVNMHLNDKTVFYERKFCKNIFKHVFRHASICF